MSRHTPLLTALLCSSSLFLLPACSAIRGLETSSNQPDTYNTQPTVDPNQTAGHWETVNRPDGHIDRVWVPDNPNYTANNPSYPNQYPNQNPGTYTPAPTYNNQPTATGRYETVRYPDGRIERIWNPNASSSAPAQGYWDLVPDNSGRQQRVWHPNALTNEH